jgi:hypothetical protein
MGALLSCTKIIYRVLEVTGDNLKPDRRCCCTPNTIFWLSLGDVGKPGADCIIEKDSKDTC